MPDHLRRLVGALLLFAAIGVAAGQALLVSCSPAGATPAAGASTSASQG